MLKIAITGPESTGKSTLAAQLAAHYHTVWVPEYARFYLQQLDRSYTPEDILKIAKGQVRWEAKYSKQASELLFCDTELTVIKIWLKFKYNLENDWIEKNWKAQEYDLYFLCNIDLPWQDDPLREHPSLEDRKNLYDLYKQELTALDVPFFEISGDETERFSRAKKLIDKHLY